MLMLLLLVVMRKMADKVRRHLSHRRRRDLRRRHELPAPKICRRKKLRWQLAPNRPGPKGRPEMGPTLRAVFAEEKLRVCRRWRNEGLLMLMLVLVLVLVLASSDGSGLHALLEGVL